MKINTKGFIKDIAGIELKDTVGKTLSGMLAYAESTDPVRSYVLGGKFATEDEVEVNISDIDFLKNIVRVSKAAGYHTFTIGQLMLLLEGLKEPKKEEKRS